MPLTPSPFSRAATAFVPGLVTSPATTAPITLYVATTGSDSNDGLTVGTPLRNVTTALNKLPQTVKHTPTINVAAGTYTENVVLPQSLLSVNVTINGDAMAATAPASGITSGTFDAAFGTQLFTNIAVCAGGGWAVDGLIGWFVQMTSGAGVGTRLPIVANTATTITLGTPVNTATYQNQTFSLVKPVVFINNPTGETVSAFGSGGGSTTGLTTSLSNYFIFQNIQFTRSGSLSIFRGAGATSTMFANCSFFDSGAGGGNMNRWGAAVVRFDDCFFYRSVSNNTIFNQVTALATGLFNRCCFRGGNSQILVSNGGLVTVAGGFFHSSGTSFGAITASGASQGSSAASSFYNCYIGVYVAQGHFGLSSPTIKNCTTGISLGYTSTAQAGAVNSVFSAVIDGCGTGVAMGVGSIFSASNSGTNTITNSTAFGVNLAPSALSSHNSWGHFPGQLVMTGNTADFTLDGTTGVSLATLQAAPGKAMIDASRFNRIVEA